ncbi:MAG: flagellar protein FliT [Burkholderiaceae bacterium]
MTASTQLLGQYRAVLAAGEQMLDSARDGRWDAVAHASLRIKSMTGHLAGKVPEQVLDTRENHERLAILKRLIEIDAQVRHLREPWVASLDRMLSPESGNRPRNPLGGTAIRTD